MSVAFGMASCNETNVGIFFVKNKRRGLIVVQMYFNLSRWKRGEGDGFSSSHVSLNSCLAGVGLWDFGFVFYPSMAVFFFVLPADPGSGESKKEVWNCNT